MKSFLLIFFALFEVNIYSQIAWSENFETSTAQDWVITSGTWEVGTPASGPGGAYQGSKCAATVLNGNYADGVDTRLVSPEFTVPAATNHPRLRFWQWYSISYGDAGKVQVKVKGSSTWIDVSQQYVNTSSGVWTRPSFDLSAFAGQVIQIAFYFVSTSSYESTGWYIDDLVVETGTPVFNNPEKWESGLGDWYCESGTWEVGTPSSGPGGAYEGLRCAATVLNGTYENAVDSRLVSPIFTVPAATEHPRLRFWHWYSIAYGDAGKVQVKVKGTSNWIDVSQQYINTSSGVWTRPSIDLSAFAGQDVQIAFYFITTSSYESTGWYIDDVVVETGKPVFNNPEKWESGLGDWYCESGTWEVGTPSSGPGGAYEGLRCAATVLNGTYENAVDSRLVSPIFTVPAASEHPRLRFWQWYSISYGDCGKVQVKVKGTSTWIDVSQQYINTSSGVWTRPSIDLSAFAGQEVQIAFYFITTSSYESTGWYIDDLVVETGTPEFHNPEKWESGLGDWYCESGTWEVGTPSSGPGGAYEGLRCAATVLNGTYENAVDSRLVSPMFTVPAASEHPRLRFWHWYSIAYGDAGKVQVKAKGSSTWIDVSQQYVNTCSGVWTRPSIDLSAFAGQEVQIAFYFITTSSYESTGWYIDDLVVETGTPEFHNPEKWESGLGDWYCESGTWEVGTPSSGPGGAYEGFRCAATVLNGTYENAVDSRLVSPIFTVPAASEHPSLRFRHWYSIAYGDAGKVQVKTKNSGTWIDVSQQYENTSSDVWSNASIDLSAFSNQVIQIAFYFVTTSSYESTGWYIDNIEILPYPNVHFDSDETTVCTGSLLELTPEFSGGAKPYSYQWSTGETASAINLNPEQDMTVWCKLTDVNNWIDYDTIQIHTVMIPVFTVGDTNAIVRPQTTEMFKVVMADDYEYDIDPNPDSVRITNKTLSVYVSPNSSTDYIIDCWNPASDCHTFDTVTIHVQNTTAISNPPETNGFVLFPNPADDFITIQGMGEKHLDIAVYDYSGTLIMHQACFEDHISIPVKNWPSGVYIVAIQNDKLTSHKTFVKQ